MTRVCLYTDQPILAKGLEAVLTATGRLQLERSYSGIPELVERLQADAPDILLLDLTPEVTFGVLGDIKRVVQDSKVVLWVNAISTELAFQAQCVESLAFVKFDSLLDAGKSLWQLSGENQQLAA